MYRHVVTCPPKDLLRVVLPLKYEIPAPGHHILSSAFKNGAKMAAENKTELRELTN